MSVSHPKNAPFFSLTVLTFILAAGLLLGPACSPKSDGWKGRIVEEDGIVVVKNPNAPLYGPEVLSLEEDLTIGGESGGDIAFATISSITVAGDGTIFVLDGKDKNIKAFDRDGGRIGTFGRPGQGPGELEMPRTIYSTERDELAVVDMSPKLVFFESSGEYIRTLSASSLMLMDARPDSEGNLFVFLIIYEETDGRYELRKVDGEFKDILVYESSPTQNSARDGFDPIFPILRWDLLSGDRLVCAHAVKFEFRIYDADGRLARKIQMNPEPVPVAKEDIDERTQGAPPGILENMKIPRHYPSFRYFVTDDEDRIWVLSWERPPGRKGYYYDIFDPEGRYIVRTVLPVVQPLIRKGRLYAAEEDEAGYPLLKRYEIRWDYNRELHPGRSGF